MRRSWPYYVAVIAIGLLAGVAIAGRPTADEPFVLDPTATTAAPATTAPPVEEPSDTEPDDVDTPATTDPDEADETDTTDGDATDTTEADTTATTDAPEAGETLDRSQVRVVLANGDGRSGLAGDNATRLTTAGYTAIELTDVPDRPLTTVIFYRPGFEEESLNMRSDLGTPNAFISVLTDPVTGIDDQGDLIVILGPDAQR